MRVSGLLLIASVLALLSAATFAQKPAPAAPPNLDLPTMIRLETTLLQFDGGGSPLTTAEKAQAANIVQSAMRDHPDKWRAVAADEAKTVEIVAKADPVRKAASWDILRYGYAFGPSSSADPALRPEFDAEKRIIEAHDPVIAIDASRRLVFTEHMLPALRQASEWTATQYKIAGPSAGFEVQMRNEIRRQLTSTDPKIATGLCHIVRFGPHIAPFFASQPAAFRENIFVRGKQGALGDTSDPKAEQWKLAEATGMIANFAGNHASGGGAAGQLQYQQQMGSVLGTAARGYSPHCPQIGIGKPADCTVH